MSSQLDRHHRWRGTRYDAPIPAPCNAPISFGTLQLGPALADFMAYYPALQIQLVLSDDQVDPVQGGFDVTLRIADLDNSGLIARKIVPTERTICAAQAYLAAHGTPHIPTICGGMRR